MRKPEQLATLIASTALLFCTYRCGSFRFHLYLVGDKLLTRDEARRIAVNIAELPKQAYLGQRNIAHSDLDCLARGRPLIAGTTLHFLENTSRP